MYGFAMLPERYCRCNCTTKPKDRSESDRDGKQFKAKCLRAIFHSVWKICRRFNFGLHEKSFVRFAVCETNDKFAVLLCTILWNNILCVSNSALKLERNFNEKSAALHCTTSTQTLWSLMFENCVFSIGPSKFYLKSIRYARTQTLFRWNRLIINT